MLYACVCMCVSQTCLWCDCVCLIVWFFFFSYVSQIATAVLFFVWRLTGFAVRGRVIFRMTGFAVRGRVSGQGAKWHFHHIVSPRGVPRRHRDRPWHKFTSRWLTRRGSFHDICLLKADRTLKCKEFLRIFFTEKNCLRGSCRGRARSLGEITDNNKDRVPRTLWRMNRDPTATFSCFQRGSRFAVAAEIVVTVTVLNQQRALGYGLNSQSQIRC